jgi:hypothetical protein
LRSRYRHLIADNVEESPAVAHDVLAEWLPDFTSALLIYDRDAGLRTQLGADPEGGYGLAAHCDRRVTLTEPVASSPEVAVLGRALADALDYAPEVLPDAEGPATPDDTPPEVLLRTPAELPRYYAQMLDDIAGEVARLVHETGVAPCEIAVLPPFLPAGLRFLLAERLAAHGIATHSHRPSRALREEPATQCLLTLAALGLPALGVRPAPAEVALALMLSVAKLDLVRARLLADFAYRSGDATPLTSLAALDEHLQQRITPELGARYEALREWLAAEAQRSAAQSTTLALDHFISRLFNELLAQPGYGFHENYDAAAITAILVESARTFRQVVQAVLPSEAGATIARDYAALVREGLVGALYARRWERQPEDAVLLTPAYTYVMNDRRTDYQVWLEVGSTRWWERLYQPLTMPEVLSRRWPPGRRWTDEEDYARRTDTLARLVLGLTRRCRRSVYLGLSELNENGNEMRGPLLQAIRQARRDAAPAAAPERE